MRLQSKRSCYFNAMPPGGESVLFNGSITGNELSKILTATGTHKSPIYLKRNATRRKESCKYAISFEVTGQSHG